MLTITRPSCASMDSSIPPSPCRTAVVTSSPTTTSASSSQVSSVIRQATSMCRIALRAAVGAAVDKGRSSVALSSLTSVSFSRRPSPYWPATTHGGAQSIDARSVATAAKRVWLAANRAMHQP